MDNSLSPSRFADEIAQAMPQGMTLPTEIAETLDWLQQVGAVRRPGENGSGRRYATLYPADSGVEPDRESLVSFSVYDDYSYDYMNISVEAVKQRLFLFAATGGEGSSAGIWLDEAGKPFFVNRGSGSGSIWFGIISDNPLVFLNFLAIGYYEPGFDDSHAFTPEEDWIEANGYDLADKDELIADGDWEPPEPPLALQAFLAKRFGITVAARASDLLQGVQKNDAFARWLNEISGSC